MNLRGRLDRMARGVEVLEPDPEVVAMAMERFRTTGELPRDTRLGRAVTKWAETGEGPTEGSGSLLERLCVYVGQPKPPPPPRDAVMRGLYEDAIFGDEPEMTLARAILCILAKCGHDPSQPLWTQLGWEEPEQVCNSMTLALVGFPGSFVRPAHRRRAGILTTKLFSYAKDHLATEARFQAFMRAANPFYDIGLLPRDAAMIDPILWTAELAAYVDECRYGDDHTMLLQALHAYWRAPSSGRGAAMADVRAAVMAGPGPRDPKHPGPRAHLKQLLRPFIAKAMDAAEQLA